MLMSSSFDSLQAEITSHFKVESYPGCIYSMTQKSVPDSPPWSLPNLRATSEDSLLRFGRLYSSGLVFPLKVVLILLRQILQADVLCLGQ